MIVQKSTSMPFSWRWALLGVACLLTLGYAIKRDIRFDKEYPGDLRNRITGARLVKDGRSPYFYKWKKGDGLRYYDPSNFDTWHPANMTSTPVLYRLLTPLIELPQSQISKWWLMIEYLMLGSITLFAFFLAKTTGQKQVVLLISLLFLMTNAWKQHVLFGQTYLCIPFFAMCFLASWQKNKNPAWAFAAGVAAVCLVLVRLNMLLFFIPFLFVVRKYSRQWLMLFLTPLLLLAGWTLCSQHERSLWQDYFTMLKEAANINQNQNLPLQHNEPDPHYPLWEGIDVAKTDELIRTEPVRTYSENGNFFVLYKNVFHRTLSTHSLGILSFLVTGALVLLYYFRCYTPGKLDTVHMTIFGFCLGMLVDLFSPIYRHQYYTVQWIFPLLIAATIFSGRLKVFYLLLLAGLLLNCIHIPFIKMGNTIGEYLILAVLLAISLDPGGQKDRELAPVSVSDKLPA
jgi:hypothetical protein